MEWNGISTEQRKTLELIHIVYSPNYKYSSQTLYGVRIMDFVFFVLIFFSFFFYRNRLYFPYVCAVFFTSYSTDSAKYGKKSFHCNVASIRIDYWYGIQFIWKNFWAQNKGTCHGLCLLNLYNGQQLTLESFNYDSDQYHCTLCTGINTELGWIRFRKLVDLFTHFEEEILNKIHRIYLIYILYTCKIYI